MKTNNFILPLFILCFIHLNAQDKNAATNKVKSDSIENVKERINPWQQTSGEILLSPYVSRYIATSYRNSVGDKIRFNKDGKFSNYNPRLFIAAPLFGEKVNIIGSIPFFTNTYEDNNVSNTNSDLGDIELGLKFHLAKFKDNYLMASLISYIPLYSNNATPFVGYDLFALETRVIFAGTLKLLGEYNNFHKIEVGLRYFFPEDPVQFRFLISEGYNLSKKTILLGEIEGMFSGSDRDEFFRNNLQAVADFKMIKASLNLGYEFSNNFTLYGGLFSDVYNSNSAIGRGFQTFAVIRLD
ncbi:hypothetical protein [Salegentibacter salarius]|uniref:Transporter n=1 Tax=Salegentibacter salarius TaxID=435906 RepID=A0A2N0U4T9_9FLAO|nr:hypothetical protein [Salegentibacter salarius]OEY71349.1 hypothetical protein BHS39_06590 [Salegentibacter salarius]PKD22031.1 hypothetical protein APR40_06585 [Salegentibacter salarius]SLJ92654.1 hypothetical protein SAMN05660445_01333 [Salegentibacter salarius]